MSKLTKLALAAVAAGAIFTVGSVATATQAEARHGFYRHGGFGFGFGYRGFYGHRFGYGYRFGLYRPWGYRPWIYRPRLVVVPSSPCRIVLRPNIYGNLVPVRVCRVIY